MTSLREREGRTPADQLHELLFGDAPIEVWAGDGVGSPWAGFAACAACLRAGDRAGAQAGLQAVLTEPHLQSRHYLQAWHALRALGVEPPPQRARHLIGVILEVPVGAGRETLAAYEDGTARHVGQAGSVVIWDGADGTVDGLLRRLLAAGDGHSRNLPPWQGPRTPCPPDLARLTYLTPGGLRVYQARPPALSDDRLSGPVLTVAARLIQALATRTGMRQSPQA